MTRHSSSDDATLVSTSEPAPEPGTSFGSGGRSTKTDLRLRYAPVALPWVVALVMLVGSIILFPSSIEFGGLATSTPLLGVLLIASFGQSLVIGTGGIDLSVSSVITLVGIVFVKVSQGQDGSIGKAVAFSLLTALLCGLVNGLLVEYLRLSPLVITLATGQVMLGVASIWYEGGVNRLGVPTEWKRLTTSTLEFGTSYVLLLGVALAAILSLALSYTAAGRRLTAASTSVRASPYQGINALRYRTGTYVSAGLLYGLAGLLLVGNIGTPTLSLGDIYQLSTIVAVVLGGAALSGSRLHPGATIAGALVLALINQGVASSGIPTGTQSVIQGVVLILAMAATTLGVHRKLRNRSTHKTV
jgi:ribose transport system permease protein